MEINDKGHKIYPVLNDMNGKNSIKTIIDNNPQISLNDLILIILKLVNVRCASVLDKPFDTINYNKQFKDDLVYYFSEGKMAKRFLIGYLT